jgi:hypothetical protein
MKVFSKARRSLAALASASSFSRGTRSILFSTRIFGCRTVASWLKMASASVSIPALASSSTQTRSASCAPTHAVDTMARSSRRFGAKMPGVSTRMIWALLSITMPRISARVVCTLRETIVTLEPTSALTSVDLPTLGAPISATKPQRVATGAALSGVSAIIVTAANALALNHHGGRDLFGGALAAANAFGRCEAGQIHRDPKLRIVMRPGALDLAINRRRQSLALRPFLQHGLGVAHAAAAHHRSVALDELRRGTVAAVEKIAPITASQISPSTVCASAPAPAPIPNLMSSISPSDFATSAQPAHDRRVASIIRPRRP